MFRGRCLNSITGKYPDMGNIKTCSCRMNGYSKCATRAAILQARIKAHI